jgi:hypothetical protein
MRLRLTGLLVALGCSLGGLLAVASPAVGAPFVLGPEGTPVRVLQGAYGDFFPLGDEAPPQASVLVLEQQSGPETAQYHLVPGTEGPDTENGVSLIYDRGSRSLFVLWESQRGASSALNLIQWKPDRSWSQVIEVTDDPASEKSPPRLAVTQDTYTLEGDDGEPVTSHRTVIHVVWSENRAGVRETLYTALILEDDSYIGSNAIVSLNELVGSDLTPQGPAPTASLLQSPVVAPGSNPHAVVLGFVDPSSRQLVTVEANLLPRELSSVADGARAHIILIGHRDRGRTVRSVAADARAHIILIGHRIHPHVRDFIADRAYSAMLAFGEDETAADHAEEMAESAWQAVLWAGLEIEEAGLLGLGADGEQIMVEMSPSSDPPTPEAASHVVQVQRLVHRVVPEMGDVPSRMFVSRDGRDVVIAWRQDSSHLHFRESTPEGGWSDVQTLPLGETLSLADAYDLLEGRVR